MGQNTVGRCPTPRVRHVAGVQGTAYGLNPRTPPLERLPLRFSVKGSLRHVLTRSVLRASPLRSACGFRACP